MRISEDTSDLVFRALFSTIFIGLGFEHLFSDQLLQTLIPDWIGEKRLVSIAAGVLLLLGGSSILFGFHVHLGATALGVFLVVVTVLVHGAALIGHTPKTLPDESHWLWQAYQRSNFVKNICLLGVCVHLIRHQTGRYSLERWLERRRATGTRSAR